MEILFKTDPSPHFLIFTDTRGEIIILGKVVASTQASTKLQIVEVDNNQEMQTSNGILATGGPY